MRNVVTSKFKVHAKYDIKGSTVDRAAKQKEKTKDSPTLKDNDLISEGRCVHIGKQSKKDFMDKLNVDVNVGPFTLFNIQSQLSILLIFFFVFRLFKFLSSLKLMDYSLLIGIHDTERVQTEEKNESDDNLSQEDEDTDDDLLNGKMETFRTYKASKH